MRIILAEDEPIIRMDIRRMLEEIGHRVMECRDGDTAMTKTLKYLPDLVLMDIKMPGTNGLTVTRMIAEKMLAPVVLLTSYSDAETVQEAMDSGALGYLVKPVTKEKLGPALKVARQRFLEMRKLRTEVDSLSGSVADREVIARAKAVLQEQLNCGEEDAYRMLRKLSMDRQRKMGEVARDILGTEAKDF